jgi:hypothetical protein
MAGPLDYAPIAATCFAVPQFLPQLRKLSTTGDRTGLSWAWAALTSVNNGAWIVYFALARYWTALIPSSSATVLAGTLAVMLARRGKAARRPVTLIGAWAATLIAAGSLAGRAGLGTLLTAAFVLQVTPSIWTAYRTARPTGLSGGTWLLILGELSCWLSFGLHKSDPRLIILGSTGVAASVLMLTRIRVTGRGEAASLAKAVFRLGRGGLSLPVGAAPLPEYGGRDSDGGGDEPGRDPERQVVAAGQGGRDALPLCAQGAGAARGHGRQHGEAEGAASLGSGVDEPRGQTRVGRGRPGHRHGHQRGESQPGTGSHQDRHREDVSDVPAGDRRLGEQHERGGDQGEAGDERGPHTEARRDPVGIPH